MAERPLPDEQAVYIGGLLAVRLPQHRALTCLRRRLESSGAAAVRQRPCQWRPVGPLDVIRIQTPHNRLTGRKEANVAGSATTHKPASGDRQRVAHDARQAPQNRPTVVYRGVIPVTGDASVASTGPRPSRAEMTGSP